MSLSTQTSLELEIAEITRLIEEYQSKIVAGTDSADNFMTITDMEKALGTLRESTNNIYTELQCKLISALDQNELLRKKKQSIDSDK
jgi:hypothetical protein